MDTDSFYGPKSGEKTLYSEESYFLDVPGQSRGVPEASLGPMKTKRSGKPFFVLKMAANLGTQ
jgi:hypothetical protein